MKSNQWQVFDRESVEVVQGHRVSPWHISGEMDMFVSVSAVLSLTRGACVPLYLSINFKSFYTGVCNIYKYTIRRTPASISSMDMVKVLRT